MEFILDLSIIICFNVPPSAEWDYTVVCSLSLSSLNLISPTSFGLPGIPQILRSGMVFKLTACPQSSRLFVISFASTHCHHKLLHKHKGILFHSFFLSSLKRKSNRNPSLKSSTWFERIELFLITYRSVKEENRDSTYKRSCRNKGAQDHTQASTNLHKTKRCNEAKQIVAPNISFQNSLMSTSISLMKIKIPWLNIYKMTDSVAASSLLLQLSFLLILSSSTVDISDLKCFF